MGPRNRVSIRERAVRRRNPKLAHPEADPQSGTEGGQPLTRFSLRIRPPAPRVGGLFTFLLSAPTCRANCCGIYKKNLRNIGPVATCHEPVNDWERQRGRLTGAGDTHAPDLCREMLRFSAR